MVSSPVVSVPVGEGAIVRSRSEGLKAEEIEGVIVMSMSGRAVAEWGTEERERQRKPKEKQERKRIRRETREEGVRENGRELWGEEREREGEEEEGDEEREEERGRGRADKLSDIRLKTLSFFFCYF